MRRVECVWSIETTAPVVNHAVRPDGCLDILYSRESGLRAVGAMTVAQGYALPEGAVIVGIRFRPGLAGAFLRIAPVELTDRTIPLSDLPGVADKHLETRLGNLEDPDQIGGLICSDLRVPDYPLNPVQRAVEAMARMRGMADLDWIARQANLSPRQFRRRCLEESGLTPKHLCRILRFRNASALAASSVRPDWAGIAMDAGYFDQAHLIRDFREFAGQTPMSVFSNTAGARLA